MGLLFVFVLIASAQDHFTTRLGTGSIKDKIYTRAPLLICGQLYGYVIYYFINLSSSSPLTNSYH